MNIKPKTYFLEPKSGRYYEEFVDGLDQNYKEAVDIESYQSLLEQAERMVKALEQIAEMKYDNDLGWGGTAKQALESVRSRL